MSTMGVMPTPDCCMAPMPGQSWLGALTSFVGMWVLMMVPMMLPSLIPMLGRYRRAVGPEGGASLGPPTVVVGLGYFLVWTVVGAILYPLGAALAALEAREPVVAGAVPIAAGAVVVIAGFVQISAWKARHVACCRDVPVSGGAGAGDALSHGVRLGLHCLRCCGNLMAISVAVGMMDLRWMALVTAAITVERVAPDGERLARAIGAAVIVAGVVLIARAAGLS
jgi:predicted metal-binding membrane protein